MDLVAPWHVESSQTRGGTPVACIGKWILYHLTTREVPCFLFLISFFSNILLEHKLDKAKFLEWLSKATEQIPKGWMTLNELHKELTVSLSEVYVHDHTPSQQNQASLGYWL